MKWAGFKDWALLALIGYAATSVSGLKEEIRELNKTLTQVIGTQMGQIERLNGHDTIFSNHESRLQRIEAQER